MARCSISYVGHPLPTLGEEFILRYISEKRSKKIRLSDKEYIEKSEKLKKSLPRYKRYDKANLIYSYDQKPGFIPEFEYEDKAARKPEKAPVIYPPVSEIAYTNPVGKEKIYAIRLRIFNFIQKHKKLIKKDKKVFYSQAICVLESEYAALELVIAYRVLDIFLK